MSKSHAENFPLIYGTFIVDGLEVALPISELREVVPFPEKLSDLSLAPSYCKGLFNLRGMIIPVVSVRNILNRPVDIPNDSKIAIVTIKNKRMGLVFDCSHEILRVKEEDILNFSGNHKRFVKGMLKIQDGDRVIQILDPDFLGNESEQNAFHVTESEKAARRPVKRSKCITFMVRGKRFGFGIGDINEVQEIKEIIPTPLETASCCGMVKLRKSIVPVIDFAKYLNIEGVEGLGDRIIFVNIKGNTIGLVVDKVEGIIVYEDGQVLQLSEFSTKENKLSKQCLSDPNGGEIILLDKSSLFNSKEIEDLSFGHNKLYSEESQKKDVISTSLELKSRESFISFKIHSPFAVSMSQVREILFWPDQVITTPDLPSHQIGAFNLRGEMVVIFNGRKIFESPDKKSSYADSRILIFENQNEKFGLLVDSVDSIFSSNRQSHLKVPTMLHSKLGPKANRLIKDFILVTENSGEHVYGVIDMNALMGYIDGFAA